MQMRTLSKNQISALKLFRKGIRKSEISKSTGIKRKSVDEAIKRGNNNIQRAIAIIQLAVDNDILISEEKAVLKKLLGKT
jgi:transcriptional regulator